MVVDLEKEVDCRVPQVRGANAFEDCLPVRERLLEFLYSFTLHGYVCLLGSVSHRATLHYLAPLLVGCHGLNLRLSHFVVLSF